MFNLSRYFKIKKKEMRATIILVILSVIVVSLLPNRTIDPWQLFNPQRFGIIVLALASMQFGGYLAIRIFGDRLGMVFLGFLGGLVSSTAVFVTIPAYYKRNPDMLFPALAAAIFSVLGMLFEFLVIVFVAAPELMYAMLWPCLIMMLIGSTSALFLLNKKTTKPMTTETGNPLDLKSIIRLALLIAGMLLIVAIAKQHVGTQAVQAIAFLGGLFETHGVSLATAILFKEGKLHYIDAIYLLALILAASYVSKFILLWGFSRNKFAVISTLYLLAMLLAGAVCLYLFAF